MSGDSTSVIVGEKKWHNVVLGIVAWIVGISSSSPWRGCS